MPEADSYDPFQLCGTTIEGKYRVTSVVGDGGFGVVYRAMHQGFDEPVAVKCLKLPGKLSAKERDLLLSQLRDEGRLLMRLSRATSGIVQALDVGAFTTAEGMWVPFLVLEWLEGETLAQYARKRRDRGEGPLSIAAAAKLLEPAMKALAVAHAQKVAHRDVKPQNLFLAQVGSSNTLKVLDFGIAKVLADHPTFTQALAATNLGPTAFTPRYGAPEQFNKKRGATGPWTDVFALALILVELASGRQALEGDDPTELYIASADPSLRPTLRARGMKAPEAVERVLSKALSVEPKHRYADARELLEALSAAIAESGAEATQVGASEGGGAEEGSGSTQAMLSTEEFAAARHLDVSTEARDPSVAVTELARKIEPTVPMTRQATEINPKLAATVPAEPLGSEAAGGASVTAASSSAKVSEQVPEISVTMGGPPGQAGLSPPTPQKTAEASSKTAGGGVASVEPSTKASGGEVAGAEPSTKAPGGEVASVEPSTKASGGEVAGAEPSTKASGDGVASAEPSTKASGGEVAGAEPSTKTTGSAGSAAAGATSAAPASAKAHTTKTPAAHDPMAETPLPDRAPAMGAKKQAPASEAGKAAGARTLEPAAGTKKSASEGEPAAAATSLAAESSSKRPTWVWIAGGLAAAALAGGIYFSVASSNDHKKPQPPSKSSAKAGPSATGRPTVTPKATGTALAPATVASAADAGTAPPVAPDDMVYIPPGVVKLGEGDTTREVTLTRGFFIDRNEVTVHAYQACMARRMCSAADRVVIPPQPEDAGAAVFPSGKEFAETWTRRCNEPRRALDHPINCIDYTNAESYCRFRGRRLPTEAEWELAARGPEGLPYPWGKEAPDCDRACFDKNGDCLPRGQEVATCTAGSHATDKTPENIYDLGGNVSEWVADGFAVVPPGGMDPKGDPSSPLRVVRGGSFLEGKEQLRATFRMGVLPETAHVSIGLRCAMDGEGKGSKPK